MRWKVEVCGHQFDLADLEVAVCGLGAGAFKDGDKTFLHAEAFEQMDSATEVYQTAEARIATVNASLRLSNPDAQPLTVGPVVDAQGPRTHFVLVAETAHFRARAGAAIMTVSGGDPIGQPPSAEPVQAKRTRLIDSDPDVAKAAKLLNAPDETLVSLAKAFEIVKGDLGQGDHKLGGKTAAAISGVSEQELLDFMDNVAHPLLSDRFVATCREEQGSPAEAYHSADGPRGSDSPGAARCSGLDRRQDMTSLGPSRWCARAARSSRPRPRVTARRPNARPNAPTGGRGRAPNVKEGSDFCFGINRLPQAATVVHLSAARYGPSVDPDGYLRGLGGYGRSFDYEPSVLGQFA